ncbi:MAG: protein NirF, partial [Pseudomonadota bacterium]|nr:protein NirF [Pseudomonadota bacterium]
MPKLLTFLSFSLLIISSVNADEMRPTGDLGVVIEREAHSVLIVNTTQKAQLARIEDLGDLSHASVVFSRDERFAYVFGRDG